MKFYRVKHIESGLYWDGRDGITIIGKKFKSKMLMLLEFDVWLLENTNDVRLDYDNTWSIWQIEELTV